MEELHDYRVVEEDYLLVARRRTERFHIGGALERRCRDQETELRQSVGVHKFLAEDDEVVFSDSFDMVLALHEEILAEFAQKRILDVIADYEIDLIVRLVACPLHDLRKTDALEQQ